MAKTSLSPAQQLAAMKKRMAELEEFLSASSSQEPLAEEDRGKIQQDEYIPVMSLLPYPLNLSTKEGGQGSTKKFIKFGEIKKILYSELVDIMEVHRTFMEAGYFYILDPRVIRQHGLDELYERILDKKMFDDLFSSQDLDHCVSIYEKATPQQKEVIVSFFVDKLAENPGSVNLNLVDRLARLSGVNIQERARDQALLFSQENR